MVKTRDLDGLDKSFEPVLVKCHNFNRCQQVIEVDSSEVELPGLRKVMVRPKVNEAVWICEKCRIDKKAFRAARGAMMERLGIVINN